MRTAVMEFINADYNTVDKNLTVAFTTALKEKGFIFPAKSVNGKFTVLKPFDEGVFIVDATDHVFHILRRNGKPADALTQINFVLQVNSRQIQSLTLAAECHLDLGDPANHHMPVLDSGVYKNSKISLKISSTFGLTTL